MHDAYAHGSVYPGKIADIFPLVWGFSCFASTCHQLFPSHDGAKLYSAAGGRNKLARYPQHSNFLDVAHIICIMVAAIKSDRVVWHIATDELHE